MKRETNWFRTRLYIGFTLFEVLVGISICGLLFLVLGKEITAMVKTNNRTEMRSKAFEVAQRNLDRMRGLEIKNLPLEGNIKVEENYDGITFQTKVSFCERTEFCSENSRYLIARTFVNAKQLAELQTVYSALGLVSTNLDPEDYTGLSGGPAARPDATPIPTLPPTPSPATGTDPEDPNNSEGDPKPEIKNTPTPVPASSPGPTDTPASPPTPSPSPSPKPTIRMT